VFRAGMTQGLEKCYWTSEWHTDLAAAADTNWVPTLSSAGLPEWWRASIRLDGNAKTTCSGRPLMGKGLWFSIWEHADRVDADTWPAS